MHIHRTMYGRYVFTMGDSGFCRAADLGGPLIRTVLISLPALLLLLSSLGCASYVRGMVSDPNLATVAIDRLPDELPQEVLLEHSADDIYGVFVRVLDSRPDLHVLTRSPEDHLLSWMGPAKAPDYLGERVLYRLKNEGSTRYEMTLTTIWVEPLGQRCRLRARRVYYSEATLPGWWPTRGDYERQLYNALAGNSGGHTGSP